MKQPPIHLRLCSECDASNDAAATRCWLCGRPLTPQNDVIVAELVPERVQPGLETLFAVLTVVTGMLSLLLILGALQSDPGIAIAVAICVGPAFVATLVRTLGRQARGLPLSWQNMFVTFFLSVAAVISLICILVVGLVVALIVVCFAAIFAMS